MTLIYLQFSDSGENIRKWSREPFEGGVRFVAGEATDEMVDAALHAVVPGGAEVWCWLPSVDAWTPHDTAREVIRTAIRAALSVPDTRGEGGPTL